jgi:hypothetical protein
MRVGVPEILHGGGRSAQLETRTAKPSQVTGRQISTEMTQDDSGPSGADRTALGIDRSRVVYRLTVAR